MTQASHEKRTAKQPSFPSTTSSKGKKADLPEGLSDERLLQAY